MRPDEGVTLVLGFALAACVGASACATGSDSAERDDQDDGSVGNGAAGATGAGASGGGGAAGPGSGASGGAGASGGGTACDDGESVPCYDGPRGTQNVGACVEGIQTCVGGTFGPCMGAVSPANETCNGEDDDCNGKTDDGISAAVCSTGQPGACANGTSSCDGGVETCSPTTQPSPEACNGVDDDCNGQVDDGNPGGGAACSTNLPGPCAAGTQSCVSGSLVCAPNTPPSPEVCGDGIDNDCDGTTDLCSPPTPVGPQGCGFCACCDPWPISWGPSPGATHYVVRWKCSVNPEQMFDVGNVTMVADLCNDVQMCNGMCAFSVGYVKVEACNQAGCSAPVDIPAAQIPIACGGGCCC